MLKYDIFVELEVQLYLVSMRIKAGWSGSVMSVYSVYKISIATRQGVEWRKTTKNTLQYFEDEADYRLCWF